MVRVLVSAKTLFLEHYLKLVSLDPLRQDYAILMVYAKVSVVQVVTAHHLQKKNIAQCPNLT
jgi:hypothetical protein